ncbi:MAG: hypothetical protein GX957_13655 [Clostridiaceae bacterium]|nr:hypothetical protein [Clostridiaceae bacterium]
MSYESILKKIEQDNENGSKTDIYRYNGLIEAIQFFSNRLTLEQITDAAFDFVNELLTVNKSVMYLLDEGVYKLKKHRGIQITPDIDTIPQTPSLAGFALYVGNVISDDENLGRFFSPELLQSLDAKVMLPLLLEEKLYGFFLLSGRVTAPFNESDIMVCKTLMHLFNNSMDNCRRLEVLQKTNQELDEKIFNLFAINQSARAMLTEHELDNLYTLSVDVFSELTLSSQTGFFLYDDSSEKFVLKAYRDVFSNTSLDTIDRVLEHREILVPQNNILDLSNEADKSSFETMFPDGIELLERIKANYVVLIYGDNSKLLGFVTLGKTISGSSYKKSTFELVESLASYTYIALSNAILLNKVAEQKDLIQEKLNRLIKLNTLSKNINSAIDNSSLLQLARETLTVSFGAQCVFITLYDEETDSLIIKESSVKEVGELTISINDQLKPLKSGRIVFESEADKLDELVGKSIAEKIDNCSGILSIPMTIEQYETIFVGAIFIFQLDEGILSNEENILIFETIANHIAPLIFGYKVLEHEKSLYKQDMAKVFAMKLEEEIKMCKEYDFDLEIVRVKSHEATPFKDNTIAAKLAQKIENVYSVSYDQTEIIINQDFEYYFRLIEEILLDCNVSISRSRYKKDFHEAIEYFDK